MMPQIGDTVRYLNAVGGGRIVKIEGQIAFVDEDGFETPVLLRECVVVGSAAPATEARTPDTQQQVTARAETTAADTDFKIEETAEGEKLTVVLAFEPHDIKRLSTTTFEAILVNDSNYYLLYSFASRNDSDTTWVLRSSETLEPQTQISMTELAREDLPDMDRVSMQIIAYKPDRPFTLKPPVTTEMRIDTTKFAKLHCFRQNTYFDNPVLAFNIITDDEQDRPVTIDPDALRMAMTEQKQQPQPRRQAASPRRDKKAEPLVIDLHIDQLLDTTAGMSHADILNHQLHEFHRVMKEHARDLGSRIVFIHGKGEGVLRKALLEQLRRHYPRCEWQDASFREYGFGATQVTIHR